MRPKEATFRFFSQYMTAEDIVLEAGAYHGYTTFGYLTDTVKFVYAFEPFPDSFRHLKHLARGNESKVKIFELGLSDHEEEIEMRGSGGGASFVYRKPPNGINAKLVPLDSLHLDPSPSVLIFDLEGMEVEAIRGAKHTVEKSVNSVLVEIHWVEGAYTEPNVVDALQEMGFEDIQTKIAGWNTRKNAYHAPWVLARRFMKKEPQP